jgi:DNA-binding protein HU-beta
VRRKVAWFSGGRRAEIAAPVKLKGDFRLNKIDLAAAVAAKTDMSKTDAVTAIEAMLDVITKALKKGTEVRLVGFGAFYVRNRKASKGRDPRTGETIAIKATKLPKFRPGKALKEAVN